MNKFGDFSMIEFVTHMCWGYLAPDSRVREAHA